MRIATWNVRTMRTGLPTTCGGSGTCTQEPRKTAIVDGELHRLNIAISALQETRLPDEGVLREAHYTFFWKGRSFESVREYGVGFAVRNDLLAAIVSHTGYSERIMSLRLKSERGYVTFISAYAPTLPASAEVKDQFYDQLAEALDRVNSSDRLYILGDFNARVGQDYTAWPDCLGNHGTGNINENGQRLLEFCSSRQLCVTNTFFKGRLTHKVSWKHPRSGHWHQLDLVISRRKDLREILNTRSFQSAECDSDHSLVAALVAISPKKIHSLRPAGKKKLNVQNTRSNERIRAFEEQLASDTIEWDPVVSIAEEWERIKKVLTDTAAKAFGYQKAETQDWYGENLATLQPLLEAKRHAALNHRMSSSPETRSKLIQAKANLQRTVRHCVNSYWSQLCNNIQASADAGNFSDMYSGIKRALGPIPRKTAPLKEADGSTITVNTRKLQRWVEHYTSIYSQPVSIEPDASQLMHQLPTWHELDAPPTITEYDKCVKLLKRGKSPGADGTYAEIIKLECIRPYMHHLLCRCWDAGYVPQDMRDANIVTLYKGKGDRGDCNNYRGISLLSIAGKLFGRVVLSRLQQLADRIYPEAQCGFRAQRSTTDMIFTLRQLQEKCREQKTPLFIAFVDLNKAFDTVSREGLFTALESIGCPPKLLSLIKSFHSGTKGSVICNGEVSEPFEVRIGVRQGCVLAPTLFGIFFSLLLKAAFGDDQQGIHLHTRADGKLFNIALLKSRELREDLYADTLLFADDAAFVAGSPDDLQLIVDKFSRACAIFSMSINAKKTVVLAQGSIEPPVILLADKPLEVVDQFCYLGSTVSNNLSLDAEINIRIGKAATMFGKLSTRVWNNKYLTAKTKMIVFQTCILGILLYGAETWTSYAKQERRLNTFYMRCLRNILGITWNDRVTNERVLEIAQMPSLTALLKQRRLRWLGHVHRMPPNRLPRRVLLGVIADAKRNVGRPLLRFKDCAKRDLSAFKISHKEWERLAGDRNEWRKHLKEGIKYHDKVWFGLLADRRRKKHTVTLSPSNNSLSCRHCGRVCRSRIGLHSHEQKCSQINAV